MNYKDEIAKLIGIEGTTGGEIGVPDNGRGDFAFPCFKAARALRKAPAKIAEDIRDAVSAALPVWLSRVEAVNGYVNFFLDRPRFISETLSGDIAAAEQIGAGRTVCIDYSSINIAKPLHIGHLPSTAIGGSLYRIFKKLGYRAVGINHLGDYGTQFGKLISVYKRLGDEARLTRDGIAELQRLYVRYQELEESDPAMLEEARAWSLKIERGEPEAKAIFERFKDITLREVERIYKRLGITFDSFLGESFFVPLVPEVVSELSQKGLLSKSDGADVVQFPENEGMPPCLILRADGASLYATRDLAAALYRHREYGFSKCLYVVAYQQNLHFKQVFRVLEMMGYEFAEDMHHVAFGMVNVEGATLSSRKGNVVLLEDILNKTVARAREIMLEKKGADMAPEQFDAVADAVGTGAVLFSALDSQKIKDVSFDIEKLLNFQGETGPYLQYTHARCAGVLEKAGADASECASFKGLQNDEAFILTFELARFSDAVREAAEKFEPSVVTKYLLSVAAKFNKFYFEHTILDTDPDIRAARLLLVRKTKKVLAEGLRLILLTPVDKM